MCVQRFDDSLNSAIHITYRISLRSSSLPEPRDPLLKVLTVCFLLQATPLFSVGVRQDPPKGATAPSAFRVEAQGGGERGRSLPSNDPSAGSPTETLLRLLLPLNDQVRSTSVKQLQHDEASQRSRPETSLNNSIGSSDGRCVQRAGT